MRNLFLLLTFSLATSLVCAGQSYLPRSTPEAEGVRSENVSALFDSLLAFPHTEIHSVVVMRHGKVIAELYPAPFAPDYGHTLYSCSKTFVGAAVGLAIQEKRLRLTDRLATFYPELLPAKVSKALASITVEDLLTMRSGMGVDTKMRSNYINWIRTYISRPMKFEPGRVFAYDSMDTYLLSAILQRATGKTLLDYLKERLFRPMGINEARWEMSPEGITCGGWGLWLTPESLAKFGQLLLDKGRWQGHQLLPAEWVEQMQQRHVVNNKIEDYGYQMWRCVHPGATRADGALGQYIVVMNQEDMVVVITQCLTSRSMEERAYIWNTLPKGLSEKPLKEGWAYRSLLQKEQAAKLPTPGGGSWPTTANRKFQNRWLSLPSNPMQWKRAQFSQSKEGLSLTVENTNGSTDHLLLGHRKWVLSTITAYPPYSIGSTKNAFSGFDPLFTAAGCYAWQQDKLHLRLRYIDWISGVDMQIRFSDTAADISLQETYTTTPTRFTASWE